METDPEPVGHTEDPNLDIFLTDLKREDPSVRATAAEALGSLGDLRAVAPLRAALEDSSWRVRANAAEALGKLGDRQAVPSLISALNDLNIETRIAVVNALGSLGDARATEPLLSISQSNPPYGLRVRTEAALKKLDPKSAASEEAAREKRIKTEQQTDEARWFIRLGVGLLVVGLIITGISYMAAESAARSPGSLGRGYYINPVVGLICAALPLLIGFFKLPNWPLWIARFIVLIGGFVVGLDQGIKIVGSSLLFALGTGILAVIVLNVLVGFVARQRAVRARAQ